MPDRQSESTARPRLPDTRISLLVRLASAEDEPAWSEFVEIYGEAVLRYCLSRGLQEADAAEVVQEVFLAVHKSVGEWEYSGRPGGFRAWLFQTAHRICLRALRNRSRSDGAVGGTTALQSLRQIADDAPETDECEREWQRWALCWAVGQVRPLVKPTTWNAFWLTAVEGCPAGEAAERLGMSIGNLYAAKCRVQSRLKNAIDDLRAGVS
jgi:RNA polymerase sigma-70 factor (ECF subfamily)